MTPWSHQARSRLAALSAAILLAACSASRGLLTLEDHASDHWGVELRLQPGAVATGDTRLSIELGLARGGYLTLLQRGTDQQLDILFPNEMDRDNRFAAGRHSLPRPSWQLAARGPAGHGRVVAIVTRAPMDAWDVRSALMRSAWQELGDYGMATARYRETPGEP